MKKQNWVGVDVGCQELVVAVERNGKRGEMLSFENTAEGHRKLIHFITKRGASARVVLEATGVYGLDLALALDRASRVEVMVANPRAISHFGRASLQRSKTDGLDAEVILEFAKRMPFEAWIAPAREILDLRAISRRMEALTKTATQEKNRLHASDQSAELSEVVREDIAFSIEHLASRVAQLRDQALQLIASHAYLQDAFGPHLGQRHCGSRGDSDPGRDRDPAQGHERTAVGGARGTRPAPVSIGHLNPQTRADLESGKHAPAPRALHARTRCGST